MSAASGDTHGSTEDFDNEARKLFEAAAANIPSGDNKSRYNSLDPIWRDLKTGGAVYVGNYRAATSEELLRSHGITRVVNCTDNMEMFMEQKPNFTVLRFDIAGWWRDEHVKNGSTEGMLAFFQPVFSFVDEGVSKGDCILIHCLAGAHRAGTMGVSYLMYKANLRKDAAILAAKNCRPIINPIGGLVELLDRLDSALQNTRSCHYGPRMETDLL
jgi:hypothetical protein